MGIPVWNAALSFVQEHLWLAREHSSAVPTNGTRNSVSVKRLCSSWVLHIMHRQGSCLCLPLPFIIIIIIRFFLLLSPFSFRHNLATVSAWVMSVCKDRAYMPAFFFFADCGLPAIYVFVHVDCFVVVLLHLHLEMWAVLHLLRCWLRLSNLFVLVCKVALFVWHVLFNCGTKTKGS